MLTPAPVITAKNVTYVMQNNILSRRDETITVFFGLDCLYEEHI